MRDIKFIGYNGEYPNLCNGTLTFSVDGVEHMADSPYRSGGRVWFDADWMEHVEDGPWEHADCEELNFLTEEEKDWLLEQFNDQVPYGCCGGCV